MSAGKGRSLPRLDSLHRHHPGVTRGRSEQMSEAANVAWSKHYQPPRELELHNDDRTSAWIVEWTAATPRELRAYANDIDTTEDAAYGIALASIQAELGLVAISRARQLTGADYIVGPPDAADFEDAYRLEVSGTDNGDAAEIVTRVQKKVRQLRAARRDDLVFACVVGFKALMVMIRSSQP